MATNPHPLAPATAPANSSAADPIRTALAEIVGWSDDAPSWQRDALRRLYVQRNLSSADFDELFLLLRQAHNLLETGESPLTPQLLDASHVPTNWNTGGVVALRSIGKMNNVNALADDQTLLFAETGLIIIYGDNGAGKSGFGRVLKRACRARDQEEILTNAYQTTPTGKPSARIKYSLSGVVQAEVVWQDGHSSNPDLSNISVFDAKCASVHVDSKTELAYTPVPLQLLQALADRCRDFGTRLKGKKTALEIQIPSFRKRSQSRDGTPVHQILSSLSATTSLVALKALAQLAAHENERLQQLKRDLAADPVKEVRKVKTQKQSIEDLIKTVIRAEYILIPSRAEELRCLLTSAKEKATAAQIAATQAFSKEPLPQAGSEVWKTLWEAARGFSTQEAYPSIQFPNTEDGAVCLLCQQPVLPAAAARLNNFELFVQQKVQQIAEDAKRAIQTWKDEVAKFGCTDETLKGVVRLLRDDLDNPQVCRLVIRTLTRARVRARKLISTTNPASLSSPRLITSVVGLLTALSSKVQERIDELQKSSDPVQRKQQENELCGLEDRVWLAGIMPDVETEIVRLQKIASLDAAMLDTDTNRISRKTTELAKVLVTNTLRDAFAAETAALSIADRRLELTQEGTGYGSTKFKVSLIRSPKAKVASVLSEGEHRCVALAAFLAELSTAHNRSGVIFDDPVSSLDHNYRELVAARLVKEAVSGRQVIVFTHDIPFLMMLDEAARSLSLPPNYQCVNRADDRAGICVVGAPSKAQTVPEVVAKVEQRLTTTRPLHAAGKNDEWSDQVKAMSGHLRDGWERAAEFAVSHVVRRFNNKVHTGGLRKMTVLTDNDCDVLKEGYGFCCTYCHTDPAAVNRPTPTPDTMRDEINRLRDWYNSVSSRQDSKK